MLYHYYKPRGPDECLTYLQNESGRRGNHHRFITEKQVFARWAKQFNITFTHPEWWKDFMKTTNERCLCTLTQPDSALWTGCGCNFPVQDKPQLVGEKNYYRTKCPNELKSENVWKAMY